MPQLHRNPDELSRVIEQLSEGDTVVVNDREEAMEVTNVESTQYEPVKMRFVQLEGPRGGLYAIRHQEQKGRPDDIGLMRYHKTKGRWVNASEGLVSLEQV